MSLKLKECDEIYFITLLLIIAYPNIDLKVELVKQQN